MRKCGELGTHFLACSTALAVYFVDEKVVWQQSLANVGSFPVLLCCETVLGAMNIARSHVLRCRVECEIQRVVIL
jgi:hypothetical protein